MQRTTIGKFTLAALPVAIMMIGAGRGEAQQTRKTPLDLIKERMERGLIHKKIILGSPAPPGAYPFQISMISASAKRGQEFDGHFCGAALIAPTWILTAGHCVTEDDKVASPKSIEVYVGSQDFRNGDRIPVKSVYRHPNYNPVFYENDIGLLQLTRAPKAGAKFKAIELIDHSQEQKYTSPGVPVTIIGWGTTERDEVSQVLQHATIKIVDRATCNKNILAGRTKALERDIGDLELERKFRFSKDKLSEIRKNFLADVARNAGAVVTDDMICAGEPNPAAEQVKDTCQGDSGGPLVAKTSNGAPIEVGIVSWGDGCGVPSVHGIYTRLGKLVDWVRETARE